MIDRNFQVVAACAIGLCCTHNVSADHFDENETHSEFTVDVHAGFAFYGRGLASGARLGIPLAKQGFIKGKNDVFMLSVGLDAYYVRHRGDSTRRWRYGVGLGFPIVGHWEFFLTPKFSFFAEIGVNIFLHPGVFRDEGKFIDHPGAWVVGAGGIVYRFSENIGFIARAGTPYISAGIQFIL